MDVVEGARGQGALLLEMTAQPRVGGVNARVKRKSRNGD